MVASTICWSEPLVSIFAEEACHHCSDESADRRILGRFVPDHQERHQNRQGDQVISLGEHDLANRLGLGFRGRKPVFSRFHFNHEERPEVIEEGRDAHHHDDIPEGDIQELHDEKCGCPHEGRRNDGPDAPCGDQACSHVG
jgi:hypothetical protein